MPEAAERQQLRFVDADELRGRATSLEGVPIMSVKGDKVIAALDGLLVDDTDRALYLVVLARDRHQRRYLIPMGLTWFDETTGVIRTDVEPNTLGLSPPFDAAAYRAMSAEESREFERRVLRTCCPEAVADVDSALTHYTRKEFQDPGWLKRPNTRNRDTSRPKR